MSAVYWVGCNNENGPGSNRNLFPFSSPGLSGHSHALGHLFCSQTEVELRGAQMAKLAKTAL